MHFSPLKLSSNLQDYRNHQNSYSKDYLDTVSHLEFHGCGIQFSVQFFDTIDWPILLMADIVPRVFAIIQSTFYRLIEGQ